MALLIASAVIGLLVGSALSSLIHRLLVGGSWMNGRSHCPRCEHVLLARDLVPLFSFIVLRGRCRHCRGAIGWFYPVIEGATAVLFLGAVLSRAGGIPGPDVFLDRALQGAVLSDWAAITVLVAIFSTDAIASVIPDILTLPAIPIFLLWRWWIGADFYNLVIAAAVGGGFFLAQYAVSRGRWIGSGDIRLGALMGVLLGWPGILIALFISYLLGAVIALVMVARGSATWKSHIPFGTFLVLGTVAVLLFSNALLSWYGTYLAFG